MSYRNTYYIEANAVRRVAHLPLFDSALRSVVSVYTEIKGRYPLLAVVGGVAEIGVRSVSQAAILRATPILLSLEPQIEVVNDYACLGLDQLEKTFPVLHQSTEEVMGHLKDAFFLTLDDVQLRVNDELDGMQERLGRLTNTTWYYLLALQESQLGQMATSGLDNMLTLSEEAMAKYLPLPPSLRLEWERRLQQYEDEDGDDEPRLWTRFRGLLLCLSLHLYHRLLKLRDRLEWAMAMLQDAADRVGLTRLLEVVGSMLQRLQLLYMSQVFRLKALSRLVLDQLKTKAQVLAELGPVKQVLGLPAQVQQVVADLQELGKILFQLLVNSTPLYNMIQQPSDQEVEEFITQQESMSSDSICHDSANSLFLKDMDGRPHRHKSLYARSEKGSYNADNPPAQEPDNQPLFQQGSETQEDQPAYVELDITVSHPDQNSTEGSEPNMETAEHRYPDQDSDEAGEYKVETAEELSPDQDPGEDGEPKVESVEEVKPDQDVGEADKHKAETVEDLNLDQDSDEAVEHKVETVDDLSPDQDSDEASENKVETVEDLSHDQDLGETSELKDETVSDLSPDQDSEEAGEQKMGNVEDLSCDQDSDKTVEHKFETAEDLTHDQDSNEAVEHNIETVEDISSDQDSDEATEHNIETVEHLSCDQESDEAGEHQVETVEDLSHDQNSDEASEQQVETVEDLSHDQESDEASEQQVETVEGMSHDQESDEAGEHKVETVEDVSPNQESDEAGKHKVKTIEDQSNVQESGEASKQNVETIEVLSRDQESDEAGEHKVETVEDLSNYQELDEASEQNVETVKVLSHDQESDETGEQEVETVEGLSHDQDSDEASEHKVETTEYYLDADRRDESPPRRKSLSSHSPRSSSSAGNPDQPPSRQGSLTPDDLPLSHLDLSSTSSMHRHSAADVLPGSILQYQGSDSEQPSGGTVIPTLEITENHTDSRDESPSRRLSLPVRSRRGSSSSNNPSNSRRDSQVKNNQPLSVEFDNLDIPSTSPLRRRSSAEKILLNPVLQYLTSEPSSDDTVIPEVKNTETTDAIDETPPRRKSLSTQSRRRSSSADYPPALGPTPVNSTNGGRGNQMHNALEEIDTQDLPSTSVEHRNPSIVDVLLDPILQYPNPERSKQAEMKEAETPVAETMEQ